MKMVRVKHYDISQIPPLKEGEEICDKNPYFLHSKYPEHQCQMKLEEVEITEEEYNKLKESGML